MLSSSFASVHNPSLDQKFLHPSPEYSEQDKNSTQMTFEGAKIDVDATRKPTAASRWKRIFESLSLPSIVLDDDRYKSSPTTPSFEKSRGMNKNLALTRTNSIIETGIFNAVSPPSPGLQTLPLRRIFTRTPRSRSLPTTHFPTVAGVPIPTNTTPHTTIPLSAIKPRTSPPPAYNVYPTGTYASESMTDDIFSIGSSAGLTRKLGKSRLALSAEYRARLAPFADSTPRERNFRAIRWQDEELYARIFHLQANHVMQRGQANRPRPRPRVNSLSSLSLTATPTEPEATVASTKDMKRTKKARRRRRTLPSNFNTKLEPIVEEDESTTFQARSTAPTRRSSLPASFGSSVRSGISLLPELEEEEEPCNIADIVVAVVVKQAKVEGKELLSDVGAIVVLACLPMVMFLLLVWIGRNCAEDDVLVETAHTALENLDAVEEEE
ncbi:hypothetical protein FA15DRAFT_708452 [Coprinopsis marcescibilis]|uniref:Uncharacterized protein n=1 Tax=Coprinopsis marcescibilis TaxID=230819 RepID=A0A5C3KIZ0_COPMA|nr:hypothetical protein FA15DRAFT_708452 [Coprinopsis marcescibilis]